MNLKDLVSKQITLQSPKAPDEITEIIKENITMKLYIFSGAGEDDPFNGKISENHFCLYKQYMGQYTMTAYLDGKIEEEKEGSMIHLCIRPKSRSVIILPIFPFLFLWVLASMPHLDFFSYYILPVIVCFLPIVGWIFYEYGAQTSLKSLTRLLEARVVNTSEEKIDQRKIEKNP